MFQLFAVSAVVMGLSYTIAKEELFRPVRDRCGGRETWLGYLVSCPYCVSHWIAFIVVPLTGTYIFFFVDETQGFVRRRKRVAEKEAEVVERAIEAREERPLPH